MDKFREAYKCWQVRSEALKQAQQGEVASSVQVQETLRRTASVASDLEAKLSATSVAQEQSRVTAERAQILSEKAMRETQMLQLTQQATAAELKEEVAMIGIRIQEQSDKTLFQEQARKEQPFRLPLLPPDRTTEQLSQRMQAEVDSTRLPDNRQLMQQSNWQFKNTIRGAILHDNRQFRQRCQRIRDKTG